MHKRLLPFLLLIPVAALHAELPTDPDAIQPLLPGMKAPSFSAAGADGKTHGFDPANRDKPAMLVFYRGGWCPFCVVYWSELRKIEDQLEQAGVEVMFLSADRPEILAEALEGDAPSYLLLSDNSMEIAEAFGIAFRVDDETVEKYKGYGIDLEQASGMDHHVLPAPAIFLVDSDGVIKFSYVNPDYTIRPSPELVLTAAKTMLDYDLREVRKRAASAE